MTIDKLGAQDVARYLQNSEAARSTAADKTHPKDADAPARQAHSRADSVTLSTNARALVAAREAVQQAPDVREEKVSDIKQRLADGTYHVPAHVLARKLLDTTQP